jgi:hypothetical protein
VCSVSVWGFQFLPADDYQPSRLTYVGCWPAFVIAAYLVLRRRSWFAAWVALVLIWIFGGLFLLTIFM